jgi:surface polysaccharide O-acyltransferase-like enzyme
MTEWILWGLVAWFAIPIPFSIGGYLLCRSEGRSRKEFLRGACSSMMLGSLFLVLAFIVMAYQQDGRWRLEKWLDRPVGGGPSSSA